ncbi:MULTISPECIES: VOC family protein [unclassified Mesorhizobium]|uniref:VOC family protein n=1 Tax=unclassified Mesorhizobium TaxID=325217 RepID=UPI00333C4259
MPQSPMPFFWYELMTTDLDAAEAFYTSVVGWRGQPFEGAQGMPRYIVMNVGERGVGGMMTLPDDARKMGMPPAWVGYILTRDIDAATASLKKAGGAVHREPDDIPGVGRFAVVADPQGAMFNFLQPSGPDQPPLPLATPGNIGWHELYTSDWKAAFDFYSSQFGWEKGDAMDMGPMGVYQLFAFGGELVGGMMNKPEQIPAPVWQFYFNVPGIDAAAKRVTDNGGKILMGPMEVPGGSWIVQCTDPQGAHFALMAPTR